MLPLIDAYIPEETIPGRKLLLCYTPVMSSFSHKMFKLEGYILSHRSDMSFDNPGRSMRGYPFSLTGWIIHYAYLIF